MTLLNHVLLLDSTFWKTLTCCMFFVHVVSSRWDTLTKPVLVGIPFLRSAYCLVGVEHVFEYETCRESSKSSRPWDVSSLGDVDKL